MRKRWGSLSLALWLALCPVLPALAWGASETAHLAQYEAAYGEAASAYRRIRYGAENAQVQKVKQALEDLGYFANRVNQSYYRTLEIAVRVFCQQLQIGGDGREITPLVQAMLADPAGLPRAISPAIDVYVYSEEKEEAQYVAYTYARLMRGNTLNQVRVTFIGVVGQVVHQGEAQVLALRMENDAEKQVYVRYEPLPRTTRFQVGDKVTVFGTTQGLQALPNVGMDAERLLVSADRVGYAPK